MASNNLPSPAIVCTESIALLHLLHSVPSLPSSNPIESVPPHQDGYSLSFPRERSFVSTLAFLSNTEDDPSHIPALCVKENPESSSLSVLLAVNRTNCIDGNQVLQELKRGFERIFAILSKISNGDKTQNFEDDIFSAIVSMCSLRILCRLRFVANNRKITKQPIKKILQEAIISLAQLENQKLSKQILVITTFTERAKDVIKSADTWNKHQTSVRLKDLVESVHRLGQIEELQTLLSIIPNRAMCPSSRRNLLNIISKVARYREAAQFLYHTARRFRLVRQTKIVLVNLPEEAFQKIPVDNCTTEIASVVARINGVHRQKDLDRICRLMKITEVQANAQFVNQTHKTSREAKIHAEIQLLFFCELNAFKLPPRVVCSSKDACFLCNAFFCMHGKMHIPRHHGRLYPGWRLPLVPKLKDMQPRFNLVLQNGIRDSLTTLLSSPQKIVYPDPNESTLLTLPVSTSTLRSLALSQAVKVEKEAVRACPANEIIAGHDRPVSPRFRVIAMLSEDTLSASSALGVEAATTVANDDAEPEPSNQDVSQLVPRVLRSRQALPFESTANDNGALVQGKLLSSRVSVDHKSRLYTSGSLEIHIEHTVDNMIVSSEGVLREITYDIIWLPAEEGKKLLEHKAASVIDAEALQDEISHELGDQNCLYINIQGTVVKIILRPDFS